MKTCIIIPVYNEAKEIGRLIEDLKKENFAPVVIDDGSTDGSGDIARSKGAFVVCHSQKMGKGTSLRDGFKYALEQDSDAVITMDGDRQHDVSDISKLIGKAHESDAGIVTGSRMANPRGMPVVRLWTNWLMSSIISALCKQKIPDTQCGFRYIRCDVLKSLTFSSSDFEIETEILIEASRKGYKIFSVPIQTIYRDEVSKINPFVDTVRFFKYILKEVFSPRARGSR